MDRRIHVRDGAVRSFHWLLVLGLAGSWITAEPGEMVAHGRIGLATIALSGARFVWGWIGSETARFAHFVHGPRAVFAALQDLRHGRPHPGIGHNPLGALMVVALLLLVAVQAGLGLFANDDILFAGPFADWAGEERSDQLTGLHHRLFHLLQLFSLIHISAILFYWCHRKENLIRPMIDGYKHATCPLPAPRSRKIWPFFLIFLCLLAFLQFGVCLG